MTHVNDAKKKGGVELTHFVSRFNRKDHVTHVNESRYTDECGMSSIGMSQATTVKKSCYTL